MEIKAPIQSLNWVFVISHFVGSSVQIKHFCYSICWAIDSYYPSWILRVACLYEVHFAPHAQDLLVVVGVLRCVWEKDSWSKDMNSWTGESADLNFRSFWSQPVDGRVYYWYLEIGVKVSMLLLPRNRLCIVDKKNMSLRSGKYKMSVIKEGTCFEWLASDRSRDEHSEWCCVHQLEPARIMNTESFLTSLVDVHVIEVRLRRVR